MLDLKLGPPSQSGFDFKNKLHYLSIHFLEGGEFGHMRLMREVTEQWMDGRLKIPGFEFDTQPPTIPESEISKIPGGDIAMGSFDKLKLEVLARDGANVIVKSDECKYWRSMSDGYAEEFEVLHKEHVAKFQSRRSLIITDNIFSIIADH